VPIEAHDHFGLLDEVFFVGMFACCIDCGDVAIRAPGAPHPPGSLLAVEESTEEFADFDLHATAVVPGGLVQVVALDLDVHGSLDEVIVRAVALERATHAVQLDRLQVAAHLPL